jgi:ATP-dependent Zn protease
MTTPKPPTPALEHSGRPREEDIPTRKPIDLWDRGKWLLLLAVLWLVLVWSVMATNPLVGFVDAIKLEVRMALWVFVLAGLEVIHQVHFLISEHSARYHQFWMKKVWGRFERITHRRLSDWTRFRIGRMGTWVLLIVVAALVISKFIHTNPVLALFQIPALLWKAMPLVAQLAFAFFFVIFQFVGLFWFLSRGGIDVYYPDDIKTRFSDVWGQDHVLERVKENIIFLENPELVEDHGGYVPGGILLWGPPGTGKTLMAEAVAGETGRPYVFVDPGAFIQMFMGVGVLKVKSLFRKLRKLALRYGGVIVFFDEADSLGNRGGLAQQGPRGATASPFFHAGCHGLSYLSDDTKTMLLQNSMTEAGDQPGVKRDKQIMGMGMNGGGGGMGTLQALLTELSGLKKPRGFFNRTVRKVLGMRPKPPPKYRILVMMATNRAEALDEALLRPGRIDRIYKVGFPSKEGRIRTYKGYFDKVQHELGDEELDKLATMTPYATGASIKDLVNEALITTIRDGRDVITWPDVIKAKQLKQLGPSEDVEYIERERHAIAVHEACHAIVAYRTRKHLEIDIATIEKGGDYLGMVASIKPEDQFGRWRSEFESDILVSLASLAGERMFFGDDSSNGVSGDLQSATGVASLMEGFYGMGSTISSYAATQQLQLGTPGGRGQGGPQREDPQEQARLALADRIEDNLARLFAKVEGILRENEPQVLAIAHALESHKTLSGEDVTAVIEGRPGPVVDGTPYVNPVFIQELRSYHEAAMRAHDGHTRPDIPLPVPPQLVAAGVVSDRGYLDAYGTATGTNGAGPNGSGPNGPYGGPSDEPDDRDDIISHGPDEDGFYEPPAN